MSHISAINLRARLITLSSGEALPIRHMKNAKGEETENLGDVCLIVIGEDPEWTVALEGWDNGSLQ